MYHELQMAYGDAGLGENTSCDWSARSSLCDFDVDDGSRERTPKTFEDPYLEALIDADPSQTQKAICSALRDAIQALYKLFPRVANYSKE